VVSGLAIVCPGYTFRTFNDRDIVLGASNWINGSTYMHCAWGSTRPRLMAISPKRASGQVYPMQRTTDNCNPQG
jgi:hypothetical protein